MPGCPSVRCAATCRCGRWRGWRCSRWTWWRRSRAPTPNGWRRSAPGANASSSPATSSTTWPCPKACTSRRCCGGAVGANAGRCGWPPAPTAPRKPVSWPRTRPCSNSIPTPCCSGPRAIPSGLARPSPWPRNRACRCEPVAASACPWPTPRSSSWTRSASCCGSSRRPTWPSSAAAWPRWAGTTCSSRRRWGCPAWSVRTPSISPRSATAWARPADCCRWTTRRRWPRRCGTCWTIRPAAG